jgi:hypothetical protein
MCPMCRATVGDLYVPEPQIELQPDTNPSETRETRETRVQIENIGAQHCRNRGTQISCVACLLAFILLLIVIVRIMMGN